MRAPDFWTEDNATARLLGPAGAAYALAGRLRRAVIRPWQAPVPVICIGNLVVGGAGKTPVALSVITQLLGRGIAAHALTRGYGGRQSGPLRVEAESHGVQAVGDEALLLARAAPTWVAADRRAGAAAAVAAGAAALVLDDAFQNPSLRKDLSLLVIDGGYGFGNGRVLPAGPLREPVECGLARADALVIVGDDESGVLDRHAGRLPVLEARLDPAREAPDLAGRRVLAFAGIGRPEKFFASLGDAGAVVAETAAFADHHPYRPAEVEHLLARARAMDALPVTTEKDAVRLPRSALQEIQVFPVTVTWRDPAAIAALLDRILEHGQS